jgi:hypothetical protein
MSDWTTFLLLPPHHLPIDRSSTDEYPINLLFSHCPAAHILYLFDFVYCLCTLAMIYELLIVELCILFYARRL